MRPDPADETEYLREQGYAQRYRDARFQKGTGAKTHSREVRAIKILIAASRVSEGPWLDMPCGSGRLSELLPAPQVQVDRHLEMVAACPNGGLGVQARGAALPFRDGSFRGTLCMRLLQHIPSHEERREILSELCRVTQGPIVLSFFNSMSLQHLRRLIARRLGKTRSGRCAVSYAQIKRDLAAAGLEVVAARPLRRFLSEQWVLLVRRRATSSESR